MRAVARARGARVPAFVDPPGYARHRPETTLLQRLVEQHFPAFRALRAAEGRPLPDYVEGEFDAPHSGLRAAITPARRGQGGKHTEEGAGHPLPRHVAMSCAQRLKRVFGIEIETCARCHGRLQVLASIEEPEVIARILAHRDRSSGTSETELGR